MSSLALQGKYLFKVVGSYITMGVVLTILAIGAAVATFVENDFGTHLARHYVYNAIWYEAFLTLGALNIAVVLYRTGMIKHLAKFTFHGAFILILIGSGLTRYFGVEGTMKIREGSTASTLYSNDKQSDISLPFALKLTKFEMERYYGSNAPSAYQSFVVVKDGATEFDYTISMNHTLSYKGYKFFQTFYDPDEKGTILSVNKDPGMEVTYLGYALLFLGLILNLFDGKSRIRVLMKKAQQTPFLFLALCLLATTTPSWSASEYVESYLQEHAQKSVEVSEAFGELTVQSRMGRMKPFNTLAQEVVYKISGKSSLYGMSPTQMTLGMISHPTLWKKLPMIQVKTPKLRAQIGIDASQKLASFEDFFDGHRYKLEKELESALAKRPSERGVYENDLIKVDERLSIAFMVYQGMLFKLYPIPEDAHHTWVAFEQMFSLITTEEAETLQESASGLMSALFERNYDKALKYVATIKSFQEKYGSDVMPSITHIKVETWYNKAMLFEHLTWLYMVVGVLALMAAFTQVFRPLHRFIASSFLGVTLTLFSVHTCALLLRWYVSGHAPMSDTYESIIYIAWSCLLFCVLFLRRSLFALAGSLVMAGIFMFVAHLGHIDPEITNLVPVLKSFWLSVHVSVITASYGFLALGCALGVFTLILYTVKLSQKSISVISHLTVLNEITLILGLCLLVIGNFLGGVWANESWGRYWGWDPKETWAYISIIVYTLILHLRLIPKLYSHYLFAISSIVGFGSILMTYFGVNFYLAGKHSYATGDPVPVPLWVYVCVGVVVLLIAISFRNRALKEYVNTN